MPHVYVYSHLLCARKGASETRPGNNRGTCLMLFACSKQQKNEGICREPASRRTAGQTFTSSCAKGKDTAAAMHDSPGEPTAVWCLMTCSVSKMLQWRCRKGTMLSLLAVWLSDNQRLTRPSEDQQSTIQFKLRKNVHLEGTIMPTRCDNGIKNMMAVDRTYL